MNEQKFTLEKFYYSCVESWKGKIVINLHLKEEEKQQHAELDILKGYSKSSGFPDINKAINYTTITPSKLYIRTFI